MAERNYPCDNLIDVYFGTQPAGYFNRTGEAVFKRQLYQCMLAQAIHMKADIETRRSKNEIGLHKYGNAESSTCQYRTQRAAAG